MDDWYSHNAYNRISRDWSEQGLLFQSQHFAKKEYEGSLTIDQLFKSPASHIGGALWHAFEHQRGYHPDPFFGGIMDEFRQPKYAYYMFESQRDPGLKPDIDASVPVLYIANAMTPISPSDVTVYTNCDSVKLTLMKMKTVDGKNIFVQESIFRTVKRNENGLPYEPLVFANAFDFVSVRAMHRAGKMEDVKLIAEGYLHGKQVIRKEMIPSRRSERIKLRIDSIASQDLIANGSDIVEIIASIEDNREYVKQLANEQIEFFISGEGEIIGDMKIGANPVRVVKGTAPLLERTTTHPGKVTVIARTYFGGVNSPAADTLTFYTRKPDVELMKNIE